MAAKGDIDDVGGVADTIASPPGTISTRPLTWLAWIVGTPTLGLGTVAAPSPQGGITADAPQPTDPDRFLGSFTLQSGAPTLGLGSVAGPSGRGDVADVFGTPDTSTEAPVNFKTGGLSAFAPGGPVLTPGSHAAPTGRGDVGDVYAPENVIGAEPIPAGLETWTQGGPALGLGSLPPVQPRGDISNVEDPAGEGIVFQVVWQTGTPSLGVGSLPAVTGAGDITNPYSWQDTVLYQTSWTYPVEMLDAISQAAFNLSGGTLRLLVGFDTEALGLAFSLTSGDLHTGLVIYANWPAEAIGEAFNLISGTLVVTVGYISYNNWPAEGLSEAFNLVNGTLVVTVGYISYNNWPAEGISEAFNLTGGTLV